MGWVEALEQRERIVAVLTRATETGPAELAADATQLLTDLRATWVREKRWRNDHRPIATMHVAGDVVDIREPRPSCPRYIVNRYQLCALCGVDLIHGRWAIFLQPGEVCGVLGTIVYTPSGHHRHDERPCQPAPGSGDECERSGSPSTSPATRATTSSTTSTSTSS